jgi:hypothetical protein
MGSNGDGDMIRVGSTQDYLNVRGKKDAPANKLRGLGDVIAAATKAVGIKPCEPCRKRQEALNRLVPFGNGNEKPPSADQLPAVANGGEKSEEGTT